MNKRPNLLFVLGFICCMTVSCSDYQADLMAKQLPEGMRSDFMDYYAGGDYKALVVAIDDENDVWAFGSAYNASSLVSAKGWAMKRCKISKQRDRRITTNCKLFAVGNNFAN